MRRVDVVDVPTGAIPAEDDLEHLTVVVRCVAEALQTLGQVSSGASGCLHCRFSLSLVSARPVACSRAGYPIVRVRRKSAGNGTCRDFFDGQKLLCGTDDAGAAQDEGAVFWRKKRVNSEGSGGVAPRSRPEAESPGLESTREVGYGVRVGLRSPLTLQLDGRTMMDESQDESGWDQHLPPDAIDTSPRWWRAEPDPTERQIRATMSLIAANPVDAVDPIVVRAGEENGASWELVEGGDRLAACVRLGWTRVPTRIIGGSMADAAIWGVNRALRRPATLKSLPLGWLVAGIIDQGGVPQCELAIRLDEWASKICETLKFARAVPQDVASALAAETGVPLRRVMTLGREKLRGIAKAETDAERDHVLRAALGLPPQESSPTSPTSPTSPGEGLEPPAKVEPVATWPVRIRSWLGRFGSALAEAVQGYRRIFMRGGWPVRGLRRSM